MGALETTRGQLPSSLRVILLGGTSHIGKSTLARYMAAGLGWEYRATDKLARHPGRPWSNDGTNIPQNVADHFATLTVSELLADVLRHYERNVLPQIDALVRARISNRSGQGLVLEGSALWPAFVTPLLSDHVAAIWLIASDELLSDRIHAESRYVQRGPQEQFLIQKFRERTLAFGAGIERAVKNHGLCHVRVGQSDSVETLAQRCLQVFFDKS